jgi:hypothetical protein
MYVCAMLGSSRFAIARKNIEREQLRSRYISRIREGALIQPIAMEVCSCVRVTNVINHADFVGCLLWGLVCAKCRI